MRYPEEIGMFHISVLIEQQQQQQQNLNFIIKYMFLSY